MLGIGTETLCIIVIIVEAISHSLFKKNYRRCGAPGLLLVPGSTENSEQIAMIDQLTTLEPRRGFILPAFTSQYWALQFV